jgi:hypothetical protein
LEEKGMTSFNVTIEIGWESNNSEIVEREVARDLNQVWEPGDYTIHVHETSENDGFIDLDEEGIR